MVYRTSLIFLFCCGLFIVGKSQSIDRNLETIKHLSALLRDNYVFPEKVGEITESLESGSFDTIADVHKFAASITRLMQVKSGDAHLRLVNDPMLEKDLLEFLQKDHSNEIQVQDLKREQEQNFFFQKVEILSENTGYIRFTHFPETSQSAISTLQAAMEFIRHTDALIIDLRENTGGRSGLGTLFMSYFVQNKLYTGRSYNRIEDSWTDHYVENRTNITQGMWYSKPVYLLTSSRTFSAAEGLAYTMQSLMDAIIVGDTTRGGAHMTRSFSVGNGFVAFIPFTRGENARTGTDWEGAGVIPDVPFDSRLAVELALNEILEEKLSAAKNDQEKKILEWRYQANRVKIFPGKMDPSKIEYYAGQFAEFRIYWDNDQLYITDINQSGYIPLPLLPIDDQGILFQAGNDYQVEFIKSKEGKFQSIHMTWPDGWDDVIQRTK